MVTTSIAGLSKSQKDASLSGQVDWTATPSGAQVAKVVFSIDGNEKWTELTDPYQYNGDGKLDTTTLANGTHTFGVKAYSTDGRTASAAVTVKVSNTTTPPPPPPPPPPSDPPPPPPPSSSFTVTSNIANGATLSGALAWTATANGATVSTVTFQIDGSTKWTEHYSPYQFNGDPTGLLDTTTLSNGGHVLGVTATATDGSTATVSSNVTVSNGGSTPPAPSTAPSPTTIPSDVPKYGFSLGGKSLFRSATDRAFELDQIKAAANGHPAVVRIDSTPGNQPYLDQWVADALARNLEPLLILFGTSGPVSSDAAASFASAQGAKWKGKVRLFEFANEPDLQGWTPEQYTADLKAAYGALKSANPDAILIAGALWKWDAGPTANAAGGAREWVTRMYAAGAKGHFDALSLHLYDDPDDHGTWNLWDQTFTMSPSVRSIMDSNGDKSIPIMSTESGGPATKYGETGQASIVDHDFNHLYSGQLRMLLVYTMLNDDVSGFGMLRDDRTRRPAWSTFQSRAT